MTWIPKWLRRLPGSTPWLEIMKDERVSLWSRELPSPSFEEVPPTERESLIDDKLKLAQRVADLLEDKYEKLEQVNHELLQIIKAQSIDSIVAVESNVLLNPEDELFVKEGIDEIRLLTWPYFIDKSSNTSLRETFLASDLLEEEIAVKNLNVECEALKTENSRLLERIKALVALEAENKINESLHASVEAENERLLDIIKNLKANNRITESLHDSVEKENERLIDIIKNLKANKISLRDKDNEL